MKVLRSSFVAAVAIFAAACGDKVNIIQPTTAQDGVSAVAVAPTAATMSIGQTVPFTAVVTATGAAATTVTWSSSDASKVSVSAAGVATAVATTPGVAVCATSTVNVNAKGCASVVVSPQQQTIPATVSIQSITLNAGGLNAPVNPAGVALAIDVRANVSPGTETVNKVVLMVGTTRADSQTFTSAQSAALRYAADEAIANQSAFPPILFTINTNKFNAATGVPTWVNGNYPISVVLYVAGNTAARSTATYQTPLTFANADGWVATVTTSGTTANALNTGGFRYDRGALSVSAVPVSYTGGVVAAMSANFGAVAAACDASGTGTRVLTLTAPVAPSAAWTGTFSQTSATAASSVTTYEFNGCAANLGIGEVVTVTATNAAGDALFNAAVPLNNNAIVGIRLDNRAPGAPVAVQNPNGRQNGWINATVGLNSTATTATSNGWMQNGAADAGVGGYVRMVRIATTATGLVDEARAATASSAAVLPAPSATNLTYCAVISATDALGNESALPAAGLACTVPVAGPFTVTAAQSQRFGVDIAAPQISFTNGGLTASSAGTNASVGATVGGEWQVTVSDTGIVGNSGMLAGSPVKGTATIRNPAPAGTFTAAQLCPIGVLDANNVCQPASTTPALAAAFASAFPLVNTTVMTGQNITGYYTAAFSAVDAAGNVSGAATRVRMLDAGGVVPALTTALFSTPITTSSVTFNANASDNFDLWKINYRLTYGAFTVDGNAGPDSLYYPATTVQTFNTAPFVNTNIAANITINNFIRQMEAQTNACNVFVLAAVAGAKPDRIHENMLDMANLNSGLVSTVIAPSAIPTTVSYVATGVPATQANTFYVSNGVNATTCANTAIATGISVGGVTVGAPTSVTLNADVFGATAVFNPPFARVDFYAATGTDVLEQIGTTTTYSTVDDGSVSGRRHRYSFAWTPTKNSPITGTLWPTAGAPGTAVKIFAVGVSAAGDALVTLVNNNVGLVP